MIPGTEHWNNKQENLEEMSPLGGGEQGAGQRGGGGRRGVPGDPLDC
jgi:hypothetical protein